MVQGDPLEKKRQIKSLKIETDNISSVFNINRRPIAVPLSKLFDWILKTAENLNLQLHAIHIPRELNKVPDSLTRLATSSDFSHLQEDFEEVRWVLKSCPTIDTVTIKSNRKLKLFNNFKEDYFAMTRD
ncbi:MAG: hypothetical protein EZS28_051385 [Streblomastix strix]|uniref:Uncharacterized protein n=1 Tax=Streblomastix strix TaxID=222440 RepID=A0A5J4T4M8_9EUKA|nr:MAG: hypothetical protein EZS28_051385 [Streblomastix strix]